jgi:prevent-host-death family protein
MKSTTISVAEGKKKISRLIQDALEGKAEIVVTKRGKPVAVIAPYEQYQQSKRVEGFRKIMKARETFLKAGLRADDIFKASRKELEERR